MSCWSYWYGHLAESYSWVFQVYDWSVSPPLQWGTHEVDEDLYVTQNIQFRHNQALLSNLSITRSMSPNIDISPASIPYFHHKSWPLSQQQISYQQMLWMHLSIRCILHIGHLFFFVVVAKSSLLSRKFHYKFCKHFKSHLQDHIKINLNIRCVTHACSASYLTMSHDLTLFCLTALTSICGNCSSVCVSSVPSGLL